MTHSVLRLDPSTAIAAIVVHHARVALVTPFVTAVRRAEHADVVVVQVIDAEGRSGWGEAAISWRVTGESLASVAAAVTGPIAEVIHGTSAMSPEMSTLIAEAVWGNAAARSAVECAVCDLAAVQSEKPLFAHLGGATASVWTDMTLSTAPPDELVRRAVEHVEAGFDVLKIKAQADASTIEGICAVREAVGGGIGLRVDANQAWSADEAIDIIRRCEERSVGLEFVEQPVAAGDIAGLARVSASVDTPIMADESVRTAADVCSIAATRAASLVNIKLAKTGGLNEALRAAAIARDAGIAVVVGCMLEGPVGVAAAASFAASVSPDAVHDLDTARWLRDPVVVGLDLGRGRTITLPTKPGLNITGFLGEEIARYPR